MRPRPTCQADSLGTSPRPKAILAEASQDSRMEVEAIADQVVTADVTTTPIVIKTTPTSLNMYLHLTSLYKCVAIVMQLGMTPGLANNLYALQVRETSRGFTRRATRTPLLRLHKPTSWLSKLSQHSPPTTKQHLRVHHPYLR